MEVVGNSIRHIEKAPPLARKPSGRLPRQRRSVNSVLTASVRRGGRFLGRGVVQGAGVVVHGAGAFSAAAWRIEQMLSQRTSGLKDDMLIQLLRASLPLVRKALNRQIFVMFHKKIALPLGQSRENPSGTPPYELCIDKLHGIDKLPLLDTIVSSLTIQAHPPFLIEGVDVVGSSWRPQIRSHHSSDIRQADNSHPSSANPPPASRGKLWGGGRSDASQAKGMKPTPPQVASSGSWAGGSRARAQLSGTASEGGEEGGMEKAAHADGEDAVIDFRVARAKVEMVIDPNTTSFVLRGRRCWTPSFRLACKRLDIVTPARVWWHMRTGVLWCAFEDEPNIEYEGEVQLLGLCGAAVSLGRYVSSRLFPSLWRKILRRNNVTDPIKFPLRVPVFTGRASVDSQDMPVASYEDVHALFALINEEPEEDFPVWEPYLENDRFANGW